MGEVLETGRDRRSWRPSWLAPPSWWPASPRFGPWSRRTKRAAIAVLVVVLVAGAGAVAEDFSRRDAENTRLDACVRAADSAIDAARDRVAGLAAYVQPGLREGTSDSTVASLYAIVAASASQASPIVEKARHACAGIAVRAWHAPQLRLRTAVVTYLDLVLASFRATSGNGREYFERNDTLVKAKRAVTQAQSQAKH